MCLWVYSLGTLSAAKRDKLSSTSSFCQYQHCPGDGTCSQHGTGALRPLSHSGVELEDVLKRRWQEESCCLPGGSWCRCLNGEGLCPFPGGCVAAHGYSLLCNEPRHPLPVCPVTFSRTSCCCFGALLPLEPHGMGQESRTGVMLRASACEN